MTQTNRYVTDTEPWNLAKNTDERSQLLLDWVIFNSAEALRIAGILLQPIMPSKTARLLDEMGVKPERRTIAFTSVGADVDYGTGPAAGITKKWDTIFPPTPSAEFSDQEVLSTLKAVLSQKTRNKMNQMVEFLAMEARLGEETLARLIEEAKAEQEALDAATSKQKN
jgi:methionyl-tRNA synthetase